MRRGFIAIVVLSLLLPPFAAAAADEEGESTRLMETQGTPYPQEARVPAPSGEAMIVDLFFIRPLGVVVLAVGTGVSIVATPLALASGTTKPVYERLVVDPYNFVVARPLGE